MGGAIAIVLAVVVVSTLLAEGLLVLVRRRVPVGVLAESNDAVGITFATLGVLYAVMLAFGLIATWEKFEVSQELVLAETAALDDLQELSEAFPTAIRAEVRTALGSYVDAVRNEEWPSMADGDGAAPEAEEALDALWAVYLRADPADFGNEVAYDYSVDSLVRADDARQDRLSDADARMSNFMLFVIIAGAVPSALFPLALGISNARLHAVALGALVAATALLVTATYLMSNPFTGPLGVPVSPFTEIAEILDAG